MCKNAPETSAILHKNDAEGHAHGFLCKNAPEDSPILHKNGLEPFT